MLAPQGLRRLALVNARYLSNAAGPSKPKQQQSPPSAPKPNPQPDVKVGPGASKSGDYKNPEYYTYNEFSFADLEVEMKKYRIPQPSPKA